ncbi:UNVERIFIED_CONTAM: hypothetical protein HDU68_005377, partial [Siphonaria sp. JEL0065]
MQPHTQDLKSLKEATHRVLASRAPHLDADIFDYVADCLWDELGHTTNVTTISKSLHADLVDFDIAIDFNSSMQVVSGVIQEWEHCLPLKSPATETPEAVSADLDEEFDEYLPPGACEICFRTSKHLGFHHLIPRMTHKRIVAKGLFTKEECRTRGAKLCRECHGMLHKTWTHMELALSYNTLEKIMADERM